MKCFIGQQNAVFGMTYTNRYRQYQFYDRPLER